MTGAINKPKVILVSTHPIQYQIPWFQALAIETEIDFSVLFVQRPNAQDQGVGFGLSFEWDIPLYEGYPWQQVQHLRGRGGLRGFFASRIDSPLKLLRKKRDWQNAQVYVWRRMINPTTSEAVQSHCYKLTDSRQPRRQTPR